jgi:hypothetical protein
VVGRSQVWSVSERQAASCEDGRCLRDAFDRHELKKQLRLTVCLGWDEDNPTPSFVRWARAFEKPSLYAS